MNLEQQVLGAMLRMARHRRAADDEQLALRVGQPESAVRTSLRRLESLGLVEGRRSKPVRLTLPGFALAVALTRRRPGACTRVNATSRAA